MSEPTAPPPPQDLPAAAYVAAFVSYVVLGYVLKSAILNWVVGPLFLLVVLHLIPRALTRRRRPLTEKAER